MIYCEKCEKESLEENLFCGTCGSKFEPKLSTPIVEPNPEKLKIIGSITDIPIIALLSFFGLIFLKIGSYLSFLLILFACVTISKKFKKFANLHINNKLSYGVGFNFIILIVALILSLITTVSYISSASQADLVKIKQDKQEYFEKNKKEINLEIDNLIITKDFSGLVARYSQFSSYDKDIANKISQANEEIDVKNIEEDINNNKFNKAYILYAKYKNNPKFSKFYETLKTSFLIPEETKLNLEFSKLTNKDLDKKHIILQDLLSYFPENKKYQLEYNKISGIKAKQKIDNEQKQKESQMLAQGCKQQPHDAFLISREIITPYVKYPSSLDFYSLFSSVMEDKGDCIFLIKSGFSSKNTFGMEIDTKYTMTLKFDVLKNEWKVLSKKLQTEGQ